MENIFIKTLLKDRIQLRPDQLSNDIKKTLLAILKSRFEGTCSHHGYIKPDSIEIEKYSAGSIQTSQFNGYVLYTIHYRAKICNPSTGSIISAKIMNKNSFGKLAVAFIDPDTPVLEIIIPKKMVNIIHDVNEEEFENLKEGDYIHIEIIAKKFELKDTKINVVGRIIKSVDSEKVKHDESSLEQPIINVDNDEDNAVESEDGFEEEEEEQEEEEQEDEEQEEEAESLSVESFGEESDGGGSYYDESD